jgi:hypothetical protein
MNWFIINMPGFKNGYNSLAKEYSANEFNYKVGGWLDV